MRVLSLRVDIIDELTLRRHLAMLDGRIRQVVTKLWFLEQRILDEVKWIIEMQKRDRGSHFGGKSGVDKILVMITLAYSLAFQGKQTTRSLFTRYRKSSTLLACNRCAEVIIGTGNHPRLLRMSL